MGVYEEVYGQRAVYEDVKVRKHVSFKPSSRFHSNNYADHYIHTDSYPQAHVKNIENTVEGYPKLQKLFQLKEKQVAKHATTPYGCRVDIDDMVPTLSRWIQRDKLVFDVVMIGCLSDNQFIYPLLTQLPINKLVSKPGFLFIWASAQKINELTRLLNNEGWAKKFRRSEEFVFVPVNKESPFYPGLDQDDEPLFDKMQWHCWMCITGTVRRSTDGHLIHCNVDTDLAIETDATQNGAVPCHVYKVAENFSTATRRLHIIPARTGSENPVRLRPGWVIMSPDVILDNFNAKRYRDDIRQLGSNLPMDNGIESLRPKSPVQKKN
ncbi:AFR736Cp [Eremothecium gossypii ATCC 10895]|uniref:AFR736Cp n=1 Tax=Eremothecium gossypii (strain ATCC 10895 / CBS 109.51 / FGSC 9923 / NRRL Y-1056) TaxID=284811 RepID=Q751T9_EREGS|nr:AFR736Cp [Eremothecium gossypii ATCC 10895]AAS54108.1 AFR736Cp [Eremothecium gossypii ATCC 10895]AEY98424.1 FAFR736Cp [Eremothecium gossypii FDAG1]